MKQHVILITLLLLFVAGVSKAQGTWDAPLQGEQHTYTASVTDGSGLATRWYVATDASGTKAAYNTVYTITAASGALNVDEWDGTGVYSVDITWQTGLVVGTNYYVFLEVDGAEGCTNRMASKITIASDFNALAYNVTGSADPFAASQGDGDIKPEDCPDDIVDPVWNGVDGHTDIGTTEVVFKVERQFSIVGWQFQYSLNDDGAALSGINNVRIVNADNTELVNNSSSGGTVSLASDQDFAIVYLKMDNVQGATINIDFDIVISGGNTKDDDGNLDSSADNATYTIKPIPVITDFGGN